MLAQGNDPSVVKSKSKRAIEQARETTFEGIAREWLHNQRQRLAPKYSAQILARLEADIFPQIGSRPIADIDAPELLDTLRKIEKRGVLETARRLRQTCGQVFRYAIVTRRAKQDPSAALKGALSSPGRKRGHKAMARDELPNLLEALDVYDGDRRTSIALRLTILTFVRTSELRGARWSEFEGLDMDELVVADSGRTDENEKGTHCSTCSADRDIAARATRITWIGRESVFVSVALQGRIYEQQYHALCLVPYGVSWKSDRSWLPSDGLDRTQRNGLLAGRD